MMRYLKKLENKDLSLVHSMIPLGSCTMKLNAASEMIPLSMKEFSTVHPFTPKQDIEGYHLILNELETMLNEITGFDATSFQPNSGAQGEYAGLLTIKAYHESNNDSDRHIILIPKSAHGTNPATANMLGFSIEFIDCEDNGNINIDQLRILCEKNAKSLAGIMITYPSTHGVFEDNIQEICQIVHEHGGQIYMDGANMNAQVGLTSPAKIGADVCHLNLHKTFSIPHGGGGPGMGPICVAKHLAPFLPKSPLNTECNRSAGSVASSEFSSASILLISYMYILMMGQNGLKKATEHAILNANYIAHKLKNNYKILFTGNNDTVAHELIIDCKPFKEFNISVEDIAKRLIDYEFHAPTMSWPINDTLMIEPTESENLEEIDRFCNALNQIYDEIMEIKNGISDKDNNVLKNAPHTQFDLLSETWDFPYSKQKAIVNKNPNKFWATVNRVNNSFGDRNLVCSLEN